MELKINTNYPSIDSLREKAKTRIPGFAFDYLDGGCNQQINLKKNTEDIRKVELSPNYLTDDTSFSLKTELFGHEYDAPFGISPIGLQGLMWPGAPEILAKAAHQYNIPFILSTVTTASIEKIAKITEGKAWYQLYYPADERVRKDILKRAWDSGYKVLVLLCDTPTFGYRAKEIKNGLSMPPRITFNNILQMMSKPNWLLKTLFHGKPNFETLKPYMEKGINLSQLGKFMDKTFSGRLNTERIKAIRDLWQGKIVLKGVVSEGNIRQAISCGLDGVIISNHGGRQIDAGESTIRSLQNLKKYKNEIKVMLDSGIRSGVDIARVLSSGADFAFLGRSFMYGVAALGKKGGEHTISILKKQLQQVIEQVGCSDVKNLENYLLRLNF